MAANNLLQASTQAVLSLFSRLHIRQETVQLSQVQTEVAKQIKKELDGRLRNTYHTLNEEEKAEGKLAVTLAGSVWDVDQETLADPEKTWAAEYGRQATGIPHPYGKINTVRTIFFYHITYMYNACFFSRVQFTKTNKYFWTLMVNAS